MVIRCESDSLMVDWMGWLELDVIHVNCWDFFLGENGEWFGGGLAGVCVYWYW